MENRFVLMDNLVLKAKISMLWVLMDFAWLALLLLNVYSPTGIKGIISGQIGAMGLTPGFSLVGAVILVIPLAMVFLTLTMKDLLDRRANIVVGMIFAFFQLAGLAFALSPAATFLADLTLMQAAAFVAPALIVWYAYHWPKPTMER